MRPKTRPENPMNRMKQVLTSVGLFAAGIGAAARGNEGLKLRRFERSQKCTLYILQGRDKLHLYSQCWSLMMEFFSSRVKLGCLEC